MKKTIYSIITLLSLGLLITCMILRGTEYKFNSSNVKNNIEFLSSPEFNGRLTGSEENFKVGDEIANLFKEYKLKPLNDNYKEAFTVVSPVKNSNTCSLKLLDGDEVVKEFKAGTDYKEDMLNFRTSDITFNKFDEIDIYQKSFVIKKDNKEYLFYVNFDKEFSFRSSFMSDSPYDFSIAINTATYNYILDSIRSGYILDVKLPYANGEKEVYNIAGKIKGNNPDLPPLILTAHYDHLGADSINHLYSGALDNASGTSFLLELARKYSSLRAPERDIIFIALNAEEFGLLGSKAFAESHKEDLKGAEVINFDMVGVESFPITFMSATQCKDNPTELEKDLESICKDKDLIFDSKYQDASDHTSFAKAGFDSITISHSDTSKIHTPKDLVENISTSAIDKVYSVVDDKITDNYYSETMLYFYDAKLLILFSTSSFLLVSGWIYMFYRNKNSCN